MTDKLDDFALRLGTIKSELDTLFQDFSAYIANQQEETPTDGIDRGTKLILDEICEGEGTTHKRAQRNGLASEYDIVFAYGRYAKPSKPISKMTIAEVYKFQGDQIRATKGKIPGTKNGTSAVGKYQVLRGTLKRAVSAMGIGEADLFSDAVQDKIGLFLLNNRGYQKFLNGSMTLFTFQRALAKEWASIADPATGRSRYGQSTGTTSEEIQAVLLRAKSMHT